jgi:hypothetical protein
MLRYATGPLCGIGMMLEGLLAELKKNLKKLSKSLGD